jgi:formylglycine-generating enzyme required for sulfatase activity
MIINKGSNRVVRGGSWSFNDSNCEVSFVNYFYPNYRNYFFGFRVFRRCGDEN